MPSCIACFNWNIFVCTFMKMLPLGSMRTNLLFYTNIFFLMVLMLIL
uniref:Uncharacterized protein n=1 Tax=Anguilla anguilla TaxID=7936 RepID=A0A0E9RLH2_ANGAN